MMLTRDQLRAECARLHGEGRSFVWIAQRLGISDTHARDLVDEAPEMSCRKCGTELRRPARLCGFCSPRFNVDAALAAVDRENAEAKTKWHSQRGLSLDNDRAGAAATARRTTTHGGKP